jgi:hypothetical protein
MDEFVRLALNELLVSTFPEMTIYFRPSGNIHLAYPCILYEPKTIQSSYSNNKMYSAYEQFQVMILSNLPGNIQKRRIYDIPGVIVSSTNFYVSDDIAHDIFNIYFKPL